MLLPPIRLTSFPTTNTDVNGLPFVGKSRNVFQSLTLLESPTNISALDISSNSNFKANGCDIDSDDEPPPLPTELTTLC